MRITETQWRLRCGLLYAGHDDKAQCRLVARDAALVFDGRDNARLKLDFWRAVTGYTFEVEPLTH